MNSLHFYQIKLERRTETLNSAFLRLSRNRKSLRKFDRFALQEGLISQLWQVWSDFSRSTALSSLKGTISATGVEINSEYSGYSISEIRFATMKAARQQPVGTCRAIGGDHLDPTYGDLSKMNKIVSALMPSNSSQLLSAFGSAVLLPDLQTVRNACAHVSPDRINDIRSLQVRYDNTDFMHPSDTIFWVDPTTNDFSWHSWVDEMKLVANSAVA